MSQTLRGTTYRAGDSIVEVGHVADAIEEHRRREVGTENGRYTLPSASWRSADIEGCTRYSPPRTVTNRCCGLRMNGG